MSIYLRLSDISFSFNQTIEAIFLGLDLNLASGWNVICGPNGIGKTTLLRLLAQELKPDSGRVEHRGRLAFLRQNHELSEAQLKELKEDFSKKMCRLKKSLNLDHLLERHFQELSLGEQKRLCLAFVLSFETEILLLDEPSNHLDQESKALIIEELKNFKGLGVLVSHDRQFLSELSAQSIFIENKKVKSFSAGYESSIKEHALEQEHFKKLRQNQKLKIKKQTQAVQAKVELINKKAKSLSKKHVAKHDHDKKEKINRAKLFGADRADSQAKARLDTKLCLAKNQLNEIKTKKTYDLGVCFSSIKLNKPLCFGPIKFEENNISFDLPSQSLFSGDKLAILGENGSGKTTLMNYLVAHSPNPNFTYIPQELSAAGQKAVLERFAQVQSEEKARLCSLIRRLGSDPSSILETHGHLSPGLWQKLALAMAVEKSHPVLFLDEPTNHMDLASIELFEEALQQYNGALIIVSHDKKLVENLCNKAVVLGLEKPISLCF